jgi:hypothetical protein
MAWRHAPLFLVLSALVAVSACTHGGLANPASSSSASSRLASPSQALSSPASSGQVATTTAAPSTSSSTYSVRTGLLTEEFATPLPTDPAQAQVVAGFREGMILWDKSQENFGLVAPVTSYVTGSALSNLKTSLTNFAQAEDVPAGVDRLFRTQVTALGSTVATITTCDDGSKYVEQNPRTGVVNPSSEHLPTDEVYVFVTWGMTWLDGHWAIKSVTVAPLGSAAAKPCLP